MDTASIRQRSLKEAAQLGYRVSAELPLSDFDVKTREVNALVDRCLVLHALIAVSHGFPRDTVSAWLGQEELISALSTSERRYLESGDTTDDEFYRGLVESVWALVWAIGMAPNLPPLGGHRRSAARRDPARSRPRVGRDRAPTRA
jgi:hypothetical protein